MSKRKGTPKTGGRKKGSTNQKITPRDIRTIAAAEALQRELEDHRPPPGVQLSKDIMGRFAHNFAALAMRLMPQFKDDGEPVIRFAGHYDRWKEMVELTFKFSNGAAPYQSPTFRAHAIIPTPPDKVPGDDAVVINLKIFENTGTAVALLEDIAEKAK
jgi:hypothetical protein